MLSRSDLFKTVLEALKELQTAGDPNCTNASKNKKDYFRDSQSDLIAYLYTPPRKLSGYLRRLQKIIEGRLQVKAGQYNIIIGRLMEQIAFLCFKGCLGVTEIKSFLSVGPQYDLIVAGDSIHWQALCCLLYLDGNGRDIVVEVKATKNKIDDQQFARMCSLLQLNLSRTSGLGIFFTLNGATGFPTVGERRQLSLRASRLRQAMFMVACKKPIIVLDKHDLFQLDQPGALIKVLIAKIRDVEQLSGLANISDIESPIKCDLPEHLTNL